MINKEKKLKKSESGVRKAIADSKNNNYRSIKTLSEARNYDDSYLIMEGDYGGQIYLSIPIKRVKCNFEDLIDLLDYLDKRAWNDKEGSSILFERIKKGSVISGGMGGGIASDDLWVHNQFDKLRNKINSFLQGKKSKKS